VEEAVGHSCCRPLAHPLSLDEAIAHAEECSNDTPCGQNHRQLADWLKELRDLRSRPVGNAAALREALKKIYLLAQAICDYKEEPTMVYRRADLIERTVNAALSAPPRNCDVGAAEEQFRRFVASIESLNCDSEDIRCAFYALRWAQMPYAEEGGAK
jgi:hypothetical protein